MRSVLVCRRPAVSAMTTSKPSLVARLTASKITDEGSAPSLPRTSVAPTRLAQISSCSVAAARKVSPAASNTFLPSPTSCAASLPIVVVLPLPLTPITSRTNGLAESKVSGRRVEREDLGAALAQERPDRVGVAQILARQRGSDLLEQPLAGAHADVGGEQDLLDVVDDARIQLLAPREHLAQTRDPAGARARQPGRERSRIRLLLKLAGGRQLLAPDDRLGQGLLDRGRRRREGDDLRRRAGLGRRALFGSARDAPRPARGASRATRRGVRRAPTRSSCCARRHETPPPFLWPRLPAVSGPGLRWARWLRRRPRQHPAGRHRAPGRAPFLRPRAADASPASSIWRRRRARARATNRYPTTPVTPRPPTAAISSISSFGLIWKLGSMAGGTLSLPSALQGASWRDYVSPSRQKICAVTHSVRVVFTGWGGRCYPS